MEPFIIKKHKIQFRRCLLTNMVVQPHSLYNLTDETDPVSLVTMWAISFCIFFKMFAYYAYSKMGSINSILYSEEKV